MHLPNRYSSSTLSSFVTTSCSAKATRFFLRYGTHQDEYHDIYTLCYETHLLTNNCNRFVLQGEVDEQPHFIMFNTSYGVGEIYSGKPTCFICWRQGFQRRSTLRYSLIYSIVIALQLTHESMRIENNFEQAPITISIFEDPGALRPPI